MFLYFILDMLCTVSFFYINLTCYIHENILHVWCVMVWIYIHVHKHLYFILHFSFFNRSVDTAQASLDFIPVKDSNPQLVLFLVLITLLSPCGNIFYQHTFFIGSSQPQPQGCAPSKKTCPYYHIS